MYSTKSDSYKQCEWSSLNNIFSWYFVDIRHKRRKIQIANII